MSSKKQVKRSSKRRVQKAGASVLPSEYLGSNSGRYFAEGSPELTMSNSAYGPNIPTSHGILINPTLSGPDLGPTSHSGMQTGGAYKFITNPETGRKVLARSSTGKKVISKYLQKLNSN